MMEWNSNTLTPLGDDDGTIMITVLPEDNGGTGLLTVRAKDQDLTLEQFEALAEACRMAADRLRPPFQARYPDKET